MDIKELKFIRYTVPTLADAIPRWLIDQAKDKNWTTDKFFQLAPFLIANPLNIIGLFVDKENVAKGFLWVAINILTEQMEVVLISFDKEYQDTKGTVFEHINDFVIKLSEEPKIKKMLIAANINLKETILFSTTHPKVYERKGWKRSRIVVMENIKEQ